MEAVARVESIDMPPEPLALAAALAEEPYWAWLDTAKMAGPACRYSVIAAFPSIVVAAKGDCVRIGRPGQLTCRRGDPLLALQEVLDAQGGVRRALARESPRVPFVGGVVGYWGYDLAPWTEPVKLLAVDDIAVPDMYLCWYDAAVIYDHETGQAFLASLDRDAGDEAAAKLLSAVQRARRLPPPQPPDRAVRTGEELRCNFSYAQYVEAIVRAKEYIAAGDIYQVNLSQRFSAALSVNGWSLYLRLRQTNPAPFAGYLRFADEVEILSSSPERFLRVEPDGLVETRPIKGTIHRGQTPEEDQQLANRLLSSVKDRAELLMIVDLERNDLGKVCQVGSVHVPALFSLETYETVHHLVATVHGRLRADRGPVDLIRGTFPGGSITGAPKIRSMEIIDELEPTRRAIYTGSVGYISAHGRMDLNIAIRTFIVRRGEAFYQVGGGIVADSNPDSEYLETLAKGKGLAAALAPELPGQIEAMRDAAVRARG
ncbi:MAG: aminodeoxychorismate synthase component I [Armatimonadetes bacterium]|nr:aminodeoxychorismate synthase component I [Armatimonadota bacterium]